MNHKIISFIAAPVIYLNLAGMAARTAAGTQPISVVSPDGQIEVRISPESSSARRGPEFRIFFHAAELHHGRLGLCVNGTNVLEKAVLKRSRLRESDSTYAMPFGKNNPVRNHFRALILNWESSAGPLRRLRVIFRAYNDGVAYRYVLPRQRGAKSIEITDEPGTFRFDGDPRMWPLYFKSYVNSHEGNYDPGPFSVLATNRLIDVPLLAEFPNGVSVSIAQANLRNYAGLYLRAKNDRAGRRFLRCDLSPLPDDPGVKVRARLPLNSPWRAVLIGDAPGRLIESDLILNLNAPDAIGDPSWLKAGKMSFYWWSGVQELRDPTGPSSGKSVTLISARATASPITPSSAPRAIIPGITRPRPVTTRQDRMRT